MRLTLESAVETGENTSVWIRTAFRRQSQPERIIASVKFTISNFRTPTYNFVPLYQAAEPRIISGKY